jgi:hypothetical protein
MQSFIDKLGTAFQQAEVLTRQGAVVLKDFPRSVQLDQYSCGAKSVRDPDLARTSGNDAGNRFRRHIGFGYEAGVQTVRPCCYASGTANIMRWCSATRRRMCLW